MIDLLVRHGADVNRRRADGRTAHTLAELHGNGAVAARLAGARGRATSCRRSSASSPRALAAIARGRPPCSRRDPSLRAELRPSTTCLLHRPAESGERGGARDDARLRLRPERARQDNVTPVAPRGDGRSPRGRPRAAGAGADVNALDGMFSATPLVWAVEGRGHAEPGADHVAVARALIAAGSSLEWTPPEGAPSPERTLEGLVDLRRAAGIDESETAPQGEAEG